VRCQTLRHTRTWLVLSFGGPGGLGSWNLQRHRQRSRTLPTSSKRGMSIHTAGEPSSFFLVLAFSFREQAGLRTRLPSGLVLTVVSGSNLRPPSGARGM
jgi:hypothetical protein